MHEELRQGLARLADPVVPAPDPYDRLLHSARRRRQRRTIVSSAAALMAVLVVLPLVVATIGPADSGTATPADPGTATPGGLATTPGGLGTPTPGGMATARPKVFRPSTPISTPLFRQLVESPTRGNLAGDRKLIDEIASDYLAIREKLLIDPALDRVRVLFANDLPNVRFVVVAFVNDTHATIHSDFGASGASVDELTTRWRDSASKNGEASFSAGMYEASPTNPYLFLGSHVVPSQPRSDFQLGLLPAGCRAETSSDGRIDSDGSVTRTWQPTDGDGFIVRGAGQGIERWRFTCDGVVRYSGPAAGGLYQGAPRSETPTVSTEGARGTVDPTTAADTARELASALAVSGLAAAPERVLWAGRIPGMPADSPPATVVTACYAGGGCAAMLQMRDHRLKYQLTPAYQTVGVGRSELVTIEIPATTKVLIVGPESATRAKMVDASGRVVVEGRLAAGVGQLNPGSKKVKTINVYNASGHLLESMPAAPGFGSNQFGEPTILK